MSPDQSESSRQKAQIAMVLGVLGGAGLLCTGVVQAIRSGDGMVPIFGGVLLLVTCPTMYLILAAILKVAVSARRTAASMDEMRDATQTLRAQLDLLAGGSQVSDSMKAIIHRDKDLKALRDALRSSIVKGDWDNAHYIIEQMDKKLGMHEEAARLLAEVDQARKDTIEVKLDEAMARIDALFGARQWERAQGEMDRLAKLFPDNSAVLTLPQKMIAARTAHKNELLAEWDAAVKREDADRGIEVLRALDAYLTPGEAKELGELARGVFKARLVNLGVQFGLAVSEQRWRDALEAGVQITDEFPNSRMAKEVAEKIDVLRIRAGMVADATVGPKAPGA